MEAIIQYLVCIKETLLCVARAIANFLLDLILWGPRVAYEDVASFFIVFFENLGIGDRLGAIMTAIYELQPHIGYYYDLLMCNFGLTLVFSAYLMRFFIRRLPVVG